MSRRSIKGTLTEQNLLKSFAGESQARSRYTIFAEIAQKEGYEQVAAIFRETAEQEYVHAKRFFSYLDEGMLEITASFPAGPIGDTRRNLQEAADGEHEEWAEMYRDFARIAKEEFFPEIATLFNGVAIVEQSHETRFRRLLKRFDDGTIFSDDNEDTEWYCRYCGFIHKNKTAPKRCPVCGREQGYFERKPDNY